MKRLVSVFAALGLLAAVVPQTGQIGPWDGDAVDDMIRRYLQAIVDAGDGPCARVFADAAVGLQQTRDTDGVHWNPRLWSGRRISGWNGRPGDGRSIIVLDSTRPRSATESTLLHESLHGARAVEDYEPFKHWDDEKHHLYPDGITAYYTDLCDNYLRND